MPSLRWIRYATRATWLAIAAAAVALPTAALAATPQGTTGGPDPEPGRSILDGVLAVAPAIAGIAGAIGIVVVIGMVVAGIGGPADPNARSTASWRRSGFLAMAGIVLVIGVLGGRAIAYGLSQGGFSILGAGVLIALFGAAVIGLAAIGLVALRIRHGHLSQAVATVLSAAAILATGTIGGGATAAATGGVYRDAVVLRSAGEATLRLDTRGVLPFAARAASSVACDSEPDGRTVVGITALELGELGPGTLRGTVRLPVAPSDMPTAEFFVDLGDLPEGSIPPSWSGRVLVTAMGADRASGRLAFDGLALLIPDKMPDEQSAAAIAVGKAWPTTISGEMSWSCQPW
jgi:hypothetical protein